MKRFTKLILASVLAGGMGLFALPIFGDTPEVYMQYEPYEAYQEVYDSDDTDSGRDEDYARPAAPSFISREGIVKDITRSEGEGVYKIRIEGEEGTTVFIKDFMTLVLGAQEIEEGDRITGYFGVDAPMILIYPPQHNVQLIVNYRHRPEYENVKIDRFHLNDGREALLSADGMLQLNFTDQTQIILQDGRDFRQDLENIRREYEELGIEPPTGLGLLDALDGRLLVVTYGATTRSIPAQTIPGEDGTGLKIIVLFERAVTLPGFGLDIDLPQVEDPNLMERTLNQIVVNGEVIEAQWQRINGAYFVPFRAVVNALGFGGTVEWDAETRTVRVSNGEAQINFTIDQTQYHVNGEVVELAYPSKIVDGRTYVPFRFFAQVFGMNNAYHFEGQVVIDNEEPMQ